MRVYLAAPYAARAQVRRYAAELTRVGFEVTSSWLDEEHEINAGTTGAATALEDHAVAHHARQDLADIDRSNLLVLLCLDACQLEQGGSGTSGGRHVETGYALAKGIDVLVVGRPENVFHRMGGRVVTVPDWHEALIELGARLVAYYREADYARAVEASA